MTKFLALALLALPVFVGRAHADDDRPEHAYFYGGPYIGSCGASCGGLELAFHKPVKSNVIEFFGANGAVARPGGIGPMLDLRLGMNIINLAKSQHIQLGVAAGAYWLGAKEMTPDESVIGAAGGVELAYSWQGQGKLRMLHVRPLLRLQFARGEVADAVDGATGIGTGKMTTVELGVIYQVANHFLLFAHVGYQTLHLSGDVHGMTAHHDVSEPVTTFGIAF